ncbi:MAG: response regulator [Sphingomicrobium sp.]
MTHDLVTGFWSSAYAPHGYCLLWRKDLILTHLVSDILIALAYFSIPIALVQFVRKRDDIEFGGVFWLFALFILACGMTHVMGAWNLWHGDYGVEGAIKVVTAIASVPTAIVLWRVLPLALAIPSQKQLQTANAHLATLVMERDQAVGRLQEEIVERQRTEAALVQMQKVEAIGQLTGGIAHDFNNLLQAISGNLELIHNRPTDAGAVERWSGNAAKAVARAARLTKQLLIFSRVQRMELSRVDVDEVIGGMRDMIAKSLGPGVTLSVELDAADCPVMTEAHQLEMTLLNLAINARDAMSDGGTLTIRSQCQVIAGVPGGDPGGRFVEILVQDDGQGMAKDVLARAADPFFTTKEVGKGTGLGLSMAFGFVRQSGGNIELSSEEGKGTVVRILLPVVEADGEGETTVTVAEAPAKGLLSSAPAPARGTAMLVDDDDDVRPIIEEMLGDAGFKVRAFAGPRDFLDAFDGQKCALMLVDFMMPDMNGAALVAEIRKRVPDQPVLFISGYSESESIDQVTDARTRVLRKPFRLEELIDAIAEIVDSAR